MFYLFIQEISELPIIDEPTESTKQVVKRYTFINSKNTAIQVINYGATVISISVADKNGHFSDVILGFDKIEGEFIRVVLNIFIN